MIPLFVVAKYAPYDFFGEIFHARECVGSSEPFEMCYFNELLPKWISAATSETFNQSALDLQVSALEPRNSSSVFFQYIDERRRNSDPCFEIDCSTQGGDVEDWFLRFDLSPTLQIYPCTSYYLTTENIATISSTTCWFRCRLVVFLKVIAQTASSRRRFAKISYLMTLGLFCPGFNSTCSQMVKNLARSLWSEGDTAKVARFSSAARMSTAPPDLLLVAIGITLSGLSLIGCVFLVIYGWNALKNSDQNTPLIICICSLLLWSGLRMIWWIVGALPQNVSLRLNNDLRTIFYAVDFVHIFFWTEGIIFILLSLIVLIMLNSWIDALSSFFDHVPESILKLKRIFLIVLFCLYVCVVVGGLIVVSVYLSQPYSTQTLVDAPTRTFASVFFVVVSSVLVFFCLLLSSSCAIGLYYISKRLREQNISSTALWGVLRLSIIFFIILFASVPRLVFWVNQIIFFQLSFSVQFQNISHYVNYTLIEACLLAAMFTFSILAIHSFSSSGSVKKSYLSKPVELKEPLLGTKYSDF